MTLSGSFLTGSCPDMAMKWVEQTHPYFGKCLYITNDIVELRIPLSYGLRIGHFSFCGGENVLYEQPHDMQELATPEGWRVRGGHRFWIAPEEEEDYFPDNNPIRYEIDGDSVLLIQDNDPWLRAKKSIRITLGDDASVQVTHYLENTGKQDRTCSIWGITSVAPGGTQHIPLKAFDGGYHPRHWISAWSYTDLGDYRVKYSRDEILLSHEPVPQKYKIGIDRPDRPVWYENRGVIFEKDFPVNPKENVYPDKDVCYETYMCQYMVEMESLSTLHTIAPGESFSYTEIWRLRKV